MTKLLRPCLVVTGGLLVLCCGVYPAAITFAAQVAFPQRANGSLIVRQGKVVGSTLIGQSVADWTKSPQYLWGRPSAASNDGATGVTVSSGSNYGPSSATLAAEVKARIDVLRSTGVTGPVPADLVTKSASGLDPDVSPAAADLQIPRLARTRNLAEEAVRAIVRTHTEPRALGFLGEPRVNVLMVNLDLDDKAPFSPVPPAPAPSGDAPGNTP